LNIIRKLEGIQDRVQQQN